jgi:hypothetical protein
MGPNPLDASQAIAAVASVGAVCPSAVSAQPPGPSPPPPPPPPPVYSTTQQPGCARVGALGRTAISRRHGTSDGSRFPRGREHSQLARWWRRRGH